MMENKNPKWSDRNVVKRDHPKDSRKGWTKTVEERNVVGKESYLESSYPGDKRPKWRRDTSVEHLGGEPLASGSVEDNLPRQYAVKRTYIDVKNSWEQLNPKRSRDGESSQAASYHYPKPQSNRHDEHVQVVDYKEGNTKIKMAIVNRKHPDRVIARAESDAIQAELEHMIDQIPAGGASPQFQGTRFEAGVLWVTCANAESKDWLVKTIDELEPLWGAGTLRAVGANNLPTRSKVLVWIPGSSAEEDFVRSRLKIQNPKLMTEDWQPLSRKVVEQGQTLAFSIDQESFNVLKELDFMPYWGLARVTFTDLAKKTRR